MFSKTLHIMRLKDKQNNGNYYKFNGENRRKPRIFCSIIASMKDLNKTKVSNVAHPKHYLISIL